MKLSKKKILSPMVMFLLVSLIAAHYTISNPEKRFEVIIGYIVLVYFIILQNYLLVLQIDSEKMPIIYLHEVKEQSSSEQVYKITNYSRYPVRVEVYFGNLKVREDFIGPNEGSITISDKHNDTETIRVVAYNVFDKELRTELIYNTKCKRIEHIE